MQLAIELLAPAAIAFATLLIAHWVLPERARRRYPAALAVGVAFLAGFMLLLWRAPAVPERSWLWTPSWAALVPARHWHWLPYVGAVAMVLGPLALAEGVYAIERLVLYALLAVTAAYFLVPTWSDLEPSRPVYIGILTGYLFALTALLEPLPARVPGRLLLPLLAGVSACTAVLVAASVSITYGRVAGVAAAALVGGSIAGRFEPAVTLARGLIPGFVVIVGGSAFVGFIEPKPPMLGLLVAPAAPLALWACALGPLSRLRGLRAGAVQVGVVLVPLVAAALMAWLGQPEPPTNY